MSYEVTVENENNPVVEEALPGRTDVRGAVARNAFRVALGILLIVGLGLVAAGFTLANNAPGDAQAAVARVGSIAPDFVLKDVSTGQLVRLSALRGSPVWINFWASWCEACQVEMPQIKKAYDRYKDKGLVVLGVDVQESPEDVLKYTKAGGYNWTFVIDADGTLLERYQVNGIPMHWFVGRDGTLQAAALGSMPEDTLQANIEKILMP